jgi:hypothetical protein
MLRWWLTVVVSCLVSLTASLTVLTAGASADESPARHVTRVRHWHPAYEHVVEVSIRPPGRTYIINGRYWTGTSDACFGWGPKQRVHTISGNWDGACWSAVIRNLTLGQTCEMTCW